MFNRTNWNRKSQLSEILTEPLYPRVYLSNSSRVVEIFNISNLVEHYIYLYVYTCIYIVVVY